MSIVYPTNGLTINGPYIGVTTNITGFASVTSASVTATDSAGKQYVTVLSGNGGSGNSYSGMVGTLQMIPSNGTSYNGSVTLQVTVTGTTPAYPNPPVT